MSLTHKHHRVPKHAGGTDHPDNIVELTVEDHAIAHFVLWKLYGKWQDKLAWEGLSNRIDSEDMIREAVSRANKGRSKSEEQKRQHSEFMKGNEWHKIGAFKKGHKVRVGMKHTEETKRKISESMKRRKRNVAHGEVTEKQ